MGVPNELANLYRRRGAIGQSPPAFGRYSLNKRHPLVASGDLVAMWASCAGLVELVTGNPATAVDGTPVFNGNEWIFAKASSEDIIFPVRANSASWLTARGMSLFCIMGRPSKNDAYEAACDVYNAADPTDQCVMLGQFASNPFGRLSYVAGRQHNAAANSMRTDSAYDSFADRDRLIVCGCTDSSNHEIYENGVLRKTQTTANIAQFINIDSLRVGRSQNASRGGYWEGGVEMVMLFDRVLKPHEIQGLSNDPYQLITPTWLTGLDFYRRSGGATIKSVADAAGGADALASLAVTLGVADIGAGADLPGGAAAELAAADLGGGVDSLAAVLAAMNVADTGAGADTPLGASVQFALPDVAGGADGIGSLNASVTTADTGAGNDGPAINAQLSVADTGAGIDVPSVLMAILKAVADAGGGADQLAAVSVSATVPDAGSAADAIGALTVLLAIAEAAGAVDAVVSFVPGAQIATVTFSLSSRAAAFALAEREAAASLALRGVSFTLN